MIAYISQNAFWGLLISAVEVYKRECFGLLIGYRDRRGGEEMYIVEHALPFQSAGRKHRGVVSNPRAHRRIERFLRNIPQLSVIGDFHSHTMWGYNRAASRPSDTDLEGMTKELKCDVILSEDLYQQVEADIVAEPLQRIKVKGREQDVMVYRLIGLRADVAPPKSAPRPL